MGSRRDHVVALVSGIVLSFAFPETDLSFLAWVSIAPLLVVARGQGWRRAFALGFVFGMGFFGSLLVWVSIVGWVAWATLILFESLFIALAIALWARLSTELDTV